MPRLFDILLTALAPAIWGSTYLVTTQWLPDGYPVTLALLRALPAALRQHRNHLIHLPHRH